MLICLPFLRVGGTEIQVLAMAELLVQNGYRVVVCCYYGADRSVLERFRHAGAGTVLLHLKPAPETWGFPQFAALTAKIAAVIRRYRPHIVHVQYLAPGLVPIIAARLAGVRRVFATVHQPGRVYGPKEKGLLRIGASLCSAFFCVSRSVETSWFGTSRLFDSPEVRKKRFGGHYTIYNAVDAEGIIRVVDRSGAAAMKKSLGIKSCQVVGLVGRLRKEKGQIYALKAFTEVLRSEPATVLMVIGSGPDRDRLVGLSERLGIADRTLWLGSQEIENVHRLYAIMDVVVVPSLFEGFGLTAAEAMAAAVPVVASAVDGLVEVVDHGATGYLVPAGDSHAMAGRLLELIGHPVKAAEMGRSGQAKIRRHFSQKRYAEATLSAYRYWR